MAKRKVDRRSNPYTRKQPKKKRFDVRTRNGFETYKSAKAEWGIRIASLKNFIGHASCRSCEKPLIKSLIKGLLSCRGKKNPCCNLACPKCTRRRRMNWVCGFLEGVQKKGYTQFVMLTLVSDRWRVDANQLAGYNPKSIIETVRRQLDKINFQRCVMGFVDGRFYEKGQQQQFHLHMHLLIPFKDKAGVDKKLKELRSKFYRVDLHPQTIGVPQKGENIDINKKSPDELKAVVSYIFKPFWGAKNAGGKMERIPEPHHARYILWMSQKHIYDIRLMYHCRECGGRILLGDW